MAGRSYQLKLLAAVAVAAVLSCIRAPYPQLIYLQHAPTVVALVLFPFLTRRFPLSNTAATCLALFLLLHVIAARYIYSYVPYDRWAQRLFGANITTLFGFHRNHFDRLVHFAFGALWVRPIWEISVRYLGIPRKVAYYTALEFVLAVSMLYEVFEWGLSVVMDPQNADAYNGQQGDMWDAQKDMLMAMIGALVALVILYLTRRRRASLI